MCNDTLCGSNLNLFALCASLGLSLHYRISVICNFEARTSCITALVSNFCAFFVCFFFCFFVECRRVPAATFSYFIPFPFLFRYLYVAIAIVCTRNYVISEASLRVATLAKCHSHSPFVNFPHDPQPKHPHPRHGPRESKPPLIAIFAEQL